MNDWFEWNGKKCTEMGIRVTELPPPTMPAERSTFTNIPGKSGSLVTLEGDAVYDDLTLTTTCVVADPSKIPAICAWLTGGGKVTFANRPGGWYEARIVNQISFDKILRGNPHREFAVNFRCKPLWYHADVQNITITASGTTFMNPGTADAEPIITVNGTGDITLMVGTKIVELTEVNGSITLDTPLMECYKGLTSCNSKMNGEFPVLKTGQCAVSWNGAVTSVVIQPNWRSL